MTRSGKHFLTKLMQDLKKYDPVIVSGLAYGIDVTAHLKCLQLNMPTIGVVAHGLDMMYPLAQTVQALGPPPVQWPEQDL